MFCTCIPLITYLTPLLIQPQKNLLRWFVRFPPTCHSRANPTDLPLPRHDHVQRYFTAGMPCRAQGLSHWKSGYPCPTVPYPFATFQYDDIVESLFPCSIKDLKQFMTKDRVEEGLPILHISAAVCTYICRCSNLKSVQAGTVRNSAMRPQKSGKRWARKRDVCGWIRGRTERVDGVCSEHWWKRLLQESVR